MKKGLEKLLIPVGLLLIAGLVVFLVLRRKKEDKKKAKVESFATAGAIDNLGSLDYDPVEAADDACPASHFADLVDSGDHAEFIQQADTTGDDVRPMARFDRLHDQALMPVTTKNVTPYNVDVANPSTYSYMVNAPRVQSAVKSRFKDYSLASMTRGDVPIRYHANIPLIGKTIQDRDDLRLDGLFSSGFHAVYNKLTGKSFRSTPVQVAGAGHASGYGGVSGGVIMDQAGSC